MIVPVILLFISGGLAGYAWLIGGPFPNDLMLLAGVMGLACMILLARAPRTPRARPFPTPPKTPPKPRERRTRKPPAPKKWIVIDGSNVMHWQNSEAQIGPVQQVLREVSARGFSAGVVFDANAGYKLEDRFLDDYALARRLDLPADRVLVVPKGTQADEYILLTARDLGAIVVTNDRYRDWAESFPEVHSAGFLIRGGYRDGDFWLEQTERIPMRA